MSFFLLHKKFHSLWHFSNQWTPGIGLVLCCSVSEVVRRERISLNVSRGIDTYQRNVVDNLHSKLVTESVDCGCYAES